MPLPDKAVIKADEAQRKTFDFKPQELAIGVLPVVQSFVSEDAFKSPDFKLSELVAAQTGIAQLQSDAQQEVINSRVLEKLKDIEQSAYKEGYELGMIDGAETGFQEAKADLLERLKSMESILKEMETIKQRLLVTNEGELIRLVFLVASKIALHDLQGYEEAVHEIVRRVIDEMQHDEHVTVRLSPKDLEFIETVQQKAEQRIEGLERVKFIADENIQSGGCLIETEYGTVDATVEERVSRVWQTLESKIPQPADATPKEET